MDDVEVTTYRSPTDDRFHYGLSIAASTLMLEKYAAEGIVRRIVELVAERYVQENYPQLVAKIDQQAIANLVIAESGKKIAEEIRLTPPKLTVVKDREVYQRGFLGGLRRVL